MQEHDSLARGEQREAPNLGEGVIFRGGDRRSGGHGWRWHRTAATPGRRHTCGSASHHQSPAPARLCPSSRRRRRLHIRYPGGRGLRGRGRTAWQPGARSAGDAAVAPRGGGSKSARPGRGALGGGGGRGWGDGSPSEPAPTPAAAGTSYWMYCFLHSGVMCAERCSANFILPCPPHSHQAPAATGGGGNSVSDSSPHGPRRCAELRFSPPPPPPRSPQCRPPAIFLLLFIAPPRSAH